MSVVHAIDGLHPGAGGPSRTVVQLTDALAAAGIRVTLLSQGMPGEDSIPSSGAPVARRMVESRSRTVLRLGLGMRAELERIVAGEHPSLIHNHGLWRPSNHWAAATARRHGIALITHPRGMLEPWALSHRGWKKRLAMSLYQRRDLEEARALVTTSGVERENLRKLGFRQPIAVIPNGVALQDAGPAAKAAGPAGAARTVLFLSRVHPVKGLVNLIRAWHQLPAHGWRLLIAGPDEGGHLKEILGLVQQLRLDATIQYVGPVDGVSKSELFRQADVFVLPTFTENFGVVVAEALSHGVPAITTRGAPWSDLPAYGCGWWIDVGVDPLVAALREAMALSDEERHEMGERGRRYVRRYDWTEIARQMIALYRWVLGQGDRPDCVQLA